jgi:hypothetical protein
MMKLVKPKIGFNHSEQRNSELVNMLVVTINYSE